MAAHSARPWCEDQKILVATPNTAGRPDHAAACVVCKSTWRRTALAHDAKIKRSWLRRRTQRADQITQRPARYVVAHGRHRFGRGPTDSAALPLDSPKTWFQRSAWWPSRVIPLTHRRFWVTEGKRNQRQCAKSCSFRRAHFVLPRTRDYMDVMWIEMVSFFSNRGECSPLLSREGARRHSGLQTAAARLGVHSFKTACERIELQMSHDVGFRPIRTQDSPLRFVRFGNGENIGRKMRAEVCLLVSRPFLTATVPGA
jgi:hypothetical protein